jgi:protein-tyrosine-phosphatase/predicted ATP-grasp superfamily ATP-dependent carboligase
MTDTFPHTTRLQRALVLGDDTRSFLAVVRGLGRNGIEVHAAPADFTSPALKSRYIKQIHRLPDWIGDDSDWLQAMEAILLATKFDVVIPCNETTLLPLYRYREQLSRLAGLAIPNDEALRVLFDKSATRDLATQLGIPVSHGRMLCPQDTAEDLLAEFGTPIVVKPIQSYKIVSLHRRGKVRVVTTTEELQDILAVVEPSETLIEAYFPGDGIGVSIFADRGAVQQVFEHHRVREADGASYYRVSASIDPAMAEATAKLAGAVDFSGIAMFEFKRHPAGSWILLEVNARPWGSMPLPLALGINFPYLWFQQIVGGESSPRKTYKVGVYGRNLMPDLKAIHTEFKRRQGLSGKIGYVSRRLLDFRRILLGTEVHDVCVADDIRPALSEFQQFGSEAFARMGQQLATYRWLRRVRAQKLIKRRLGGGGRILFVCNGNICRSPFAEGLLTTLALPGVTVRSAGTMPLAGRPAPDLAQQQALLHGVDLSSHRSKILDTVDIEHSNLIVTFDSINWHDIISKYPYVINKTLRFGDLISINEVDDPVNGNAHVFNEVYHQIATAVAALVNCVCRI